MSAFNVIYLDSYHAGDDVFIADLARNLLSWKDLGRRGMIVQSAGEALRRLVEGRGLSVLQSVAQLPSNLAQDAERVVAESNKRLVAQLTEMGLAAVGIKGSDRRTISFNARGETQLKSAWLDGIALSGVVPVLAPLARSFDGATIAIDPGLILNQLALRSGTRIIVFPKGVRYSNSGGLEIPPEATAGETLLHDLEEIGRILDSEVVFLTHPRCLKSAKIDGKWMSDLI